MTTTLEPAPAVPGLRRRHVLVAVSGHCVAALAALGLPPYLPAMLPALGDPTARWAGVLYVIPTAATVLSAPLWGRLADRLGRRRLLLRAQLGLAVAFWLAAQAGSVGQLAAALAAQGLLGGTFAATGAYLAAGLSGHGLARALTLAQGSARLALAAAPTAAGLLASHVPPQHLYAYAAILPLVAALATLLLPEPPAIPTPPPITPATPTALPATPAAVPAMRAAVRIAAPAEAAAVPAALPGGAVAVPAAEVGGVTATGPVAVSAPAAAQTVALPATRAAVPTATPAEAIAVPAAEVGSVTATGPVGVSTAARARPAVGVGLVCAAEFGFVFATVITFPYLLPVVARVAPAAPAALGGALFALPHLIYLLAAVPALARLRRRPLSGLATGFGCAAVGAAAHPAAVWLAGTSGRPVAVVVLVAGRLALGAALVAGLVSLSVLAAGVAATVAPGRLFGTVEAWSKGGAVLAGLLASLLAAYAGPAAPPVAGAVAASAAAVLLLRRRP